METLTSPLQRLSIGLQLRPVLLRPLQLLAGSPYKKLFAILEKLNIGYFFYIGGNDSMDTIGKLAEYGERTPEFSCACPGAVFLFLITF